MAQPAEAEDCQPWRSSRSTSSAHRVPNRRQHPSSPTPARPSPCWPIWLSHARRIPATPWPPCSGPSWTRRGRGPCCRRTLSALKAGRELPWLADRAGTGATGAGRRPLVRPPRIRALLSPSCPATVGRRRSLCALPRQLGTQRPASTPTISWPVSPCATAQPSTTGNSFRRKGYRNALAEVLEALVQCACRAHEWPARHPPCAARLAFDPLHEPAQRQLMLLYAWDNQRAAALRQYQECARILNEELGVPPLEETTVLYTAILNHATPAPPTAHVARPRPAQAPAAPAPVLVGRAEEWAALQAAYQAASRRAAWSSSKGRRVWARPPLPPPLPGIGRTAGPRC